MIAVKPGVVAAACADIAAVANDALVISIAAGVTLASLEGALNAGRRVVRVMPNTPCLVGMAAAAFALGSTATPADKEATSLIFGAVGLALEVPEGNLDAVTGLSGSGPAYVYQFVSRGLTTTTNEPPRRRTPPIHLPTRSPTHPLTRSPARTD